MAIIGIVLVVFVILNCEAITEYDRSSIMHADSRVEDTNNSLNTT